MSLALFPASAQRCHENVQVSVHELEALLHGIAGSGGRVVRSVWISSPHGMFGHALAHMLEEVGYRASRAPRPPAGTDVALIDLCHRPPPWPPPPVSVPALGLVCDGKDVLPALLLAGYRGYVMANDPHEAIGKAFDAILDGEVWAERRVLARSLDLARRGRSSTGQAKGRLTEREHQVRELVERGFSNAKIAYDLGISEKTVKVHLTNVFRKLGVRNRVSLILRGSAEGGYEDEGREPKG